MHFSPSRAVVTGASSGIGAAFARALAERGADLVLVARRADRLTSLAAELQSAFDIEATVVVLDLSVDGAANVLREQVVDGLPIDMVVNCAGFGTYGPFVAQDGRRLQDEIQINVGAVVATTHAFLPPMIGRGRGAIVNVASLFAYQPTPNMAVYGAAKSFVLNLTEALWYETRKTGVKVLVVSPGPTRTEFFNALPGMRPPAQVFQTPEQVVNTTMRALDRRNSPPSIASGTLANGLSRITRLVPRRTALGIAARITAPPSLREQRDGNVSAD